MRILHIGDFHFKSKGRNFDQERFVEKLVIHLSKKDKIDLVFFSGDLVFSGSNQIDFEKAHELLFIPLQNKLNIDWNRFIITPGNHDINRQECSEALMLYFNNRENISSNELLNEFFVKKGKDYENSINSIRNYYEYTKKNFLSSNDIIEPLYSVYKRIVLDKEIGIVSINSAWLSSSFLEDKNNLLFPSVIIKEALSKIKSSKIKILLKHHPLHYFKEFNFMELQNLIHQEFDLMFSGHLHKEENSIVYKGTNGIYCNVTQAALTYDRDSELGYSIVNIDFEDIENLVIDKATYIKKQNDFIDLESINVTMPVGIEKQKQNRFRKKIVEKYSIELENANQLLLNYNLDGFDQNFIETFTEPLLNKQSEAEETANIGSLKVSFETLLGDELNYLIFGKDKCGKTSLLRRIQLFYLKNYSFSGYIPYYFDYKEWESKTDNIDLLRIIANYYQINFSDTKGLFQSNKFIILIDNLNVLSPLHNYIVDFLILYKARFLICSEYITSRVYSTSILDNLDFERIFFKDLTRKEIRLYAEKNNTVKEDRKDEVVERITNFCAQLKLPLNFWTISIILLIFRKSNDDYSKNLFAILDSCVDEMLQKKKLAFIKGGLEFDQLKEICSQLAFHLLKEYKPLVYSSKASEIINFIEDYKKKNRRIVGDAKDIFDILIDSGILKRNVDLYTFRLNGIFEYFLAYFLNDHPQYIEEILTDDSIYLSFKNELEIYSGFNRKNEDLIEKIFVKSLEKFNPIFDSYKKIGNIDDILDIKLNKARDFSKIIKQLVVKNPLDNHIQDEIKDELSPLNIDSDVHLKEYINTEEINFELLEKYISILARVFKNSDRILNQDLINKIFNFLIEGYCYLGYYLIDEIENYAKTENLKLSPDELDDKIIGENILQLVSNFIPLLVQAMIYDGIGHNNMKDIIIQKIDELNIDKKQNQYKLFLMYFLLFDIDISKKNLIDNVFSDVTKSALKVSTFLKLNYYLAFKAYKNKPLEQFFRNKIQFAQLRLDSKTDLGDIQKFLSNKSKKNIIRKQSKE